MSVAYIAVGSNLGNRASYCKKAIDAMRCLRLTEMKQCSVFFESAPVGFLDQPDFVNGIVQLETSLSPTELLYELLSIEKSMGRVRKKSGEVPLQEKWGPRIIDLDIIDYDHLRLTTAELILPHPRAFERDFIVRPLYELGYFKDAFSYSPSSVSNGQISKAMPKTKSVSPSWLSSSMK